MTPTQTIDRLEALLEKATKGKWKRDDHALGKTERTICGDGCIVFATCTNRNSNNMARQLEMQANDLDCTEALHNAAPLLLALAREAELSRKVWPNELRDDMHTTPEIDALWKARATTDRLAKETKP